MNSVMDIQFFEIQFFEIQFFEIHFFEIQFFEKTMKNQEKTMTNHEQTMKNQEKTMKNHEKQWNTMKNHENPWKHSFFSFFAPIGPFFGPGSLTGAYTCLETGPTTTSGPTVAVPRPRWWLQFPGLADGWADAQ